MFPESWECVGENLPSLFHWIVELDVVLIVFFRKASAEEIDLGFIKDKTRWELPLVLTLWDEVPSVLGN